MGLCLYIYTVTTVTTLNILGESFERNIQFHCFSKYFRIKFIHSRLFWADLLSQNHLTFFIIPAVVAEWAKNYSRGTLKVPGSNHAWGCMMEKIQNKKEL